MIHTPVKDEILRRTKDYKPTLIRMNQNTFNALQVEYNEHRKVFSTYPTQTKVLTHMLGVKIEINNALDDIELCF